HLAGFVAPRRVPHLAIRHLSHVPRDDAVHETRGVATPDEILEERRNIDEPGGISNSVVLVLVVRLIRADRVVSRPVAIVQRLAKWKRARVKYSSNRHDAINYAP